MVFAIGFVKKIIFAHGFVATHGINSLYWYSQMVLKLIPFESWLRLGKIILLHFSLTLFLLDN